MAEAEIRFSRHALKRAQERGASEDLVREAIRKGEREPAQRGLWLYRFNREFNREWAGKHYAIQQVAPIVADEGDRMVVISVYVFYF
jgi:hypothetical protein